VIILIPALVCLIGLLMYALCVNGKLSEIGRIMFAFGLLVTLMQLPSHSINLLH
jgi:Na+/phosphate symporter